jgi:hypothetical protein
MGSGPRPGRVTTLFIAGVGTLSLACESFSSPATSGMTLPHNVIAPLSGVSRFFRDITRETSTSRNLTATGNPKATRMVIYETGDGSKKVTITVDQYASSSDASSAYEQAVQESQSVSGFEPVPVPTLGQQTFAGTTTMGAETHIGLGTLDHKLIVGATLAGYDATPDNAAKLVALARMQAATVKRAVGPRGSR